MSKNWKDIFKSSHWDNLFENENWKSAIGVFSFDNDKLKLHHFCLYEEEKCSSQLQLLKDELLSDEEFGLTDIADKLTYVAFENENYIKFLELVNEMEENNEIQS